MTSGTSPASFTAWELQQNAGPGNLSTGCHQLDQVLGGGIPVRGVTEVSGEAGAGKTQLCLQLMLQAQLPMEHNGLNGSAIYISTEGEPPLRRMNQLASAYHNRIKGRLNGKNLCVLRMDKIYVEKVWTIDGLVQLLSVRLPFLLEQKQVRLIILDSIAALLRQELVANSEEFGERSQVMFWVAAQMKCLSDMYAAPFVVVNQVSDLFSEESSTRARKTIPALGLAWANCVNFRVLLSRRKEDIPRLVSASGQNPSGQVQQRFKRDALLDNVFQRQDSAAMLSSPHQITAIEGNTITIPERIMTVLTAPHIGMTSASYVIKTDGLCTGGVEGTKEHHYQSNEEHTIFFYIISKEEMFGVRPLHNQQVRKDAVHPQLPHQDKYTSCDE